MMRDKIYSHTKFALTILQQNRRQYSILNKKYHIRPMLQKTHNPQQLINRKVVFWEKDKKSGYDTEEKLPFWKHALLGFGQLKGELALFWQEMKDLWEQDPYLIARPGETDLIWCFNNSTVLDNFVTTCDSDHNEGFSKCSLEMSPAGRALFHGYLDIRVPKDGKIKRAGYCSFRSKRVRKSFKRDSTYDWHLYNTLVIKVRGDGRSYIINLSCEGYYDITWNDIYHYVLYTRGGPYWQIAKIPFSKFVLGSKGRLQDKQNRINSNKVTHIGIACGDRIPGEFEMEIEYIGLEFDPTHDEEFAYEMYKTERYIVGV